MRPVPQVKKRDGSLVDFDESKIADAIYKAALSVGGEDRFLAEELASVVALFMEKTYQERVPTIEDVQDMVEKVLIETGHAQTAKAYILYRERRAKLRDAQARTPSPAQRSLFEPAPASLLDGAAERRVDLDREVLARSIAAEADLEQETAAEVAALVVERLGELDLDRVSGSLLGRLVDAELLDKGLLQAVRARGQAGLPRHRMHAALFPKESDRLGTPAARISGALLRQYALEEVYDEEVSEAHLAGRIHLSGLENPTAVYCASLSPDAIRTFGVPGLSGRFRAAAVGTPRRFTALLGRAVRALAPHVTHGLSISRLNLLMAPLLTGMSYDDLKEEAWAMLSDLAGVRGLELELCLAPPAVLAARKATGPAGEAMAETYSRFRGTSHQFAAAFLDVRGTASGLGPRAELPRVDLVLGPGALEEDAARSVVARAVGEAMAREPLRLVLDREDLPLLGTSRVRVRLEDATRLTATTTMGVTVGGRVTVNLPRAAYRAGERNVGGFLREAEAAAELAFEGLRSRRGFLARAGAGPDGPLAPYARGRGEGPPALDLERATWSLGVTGLNEAAAHLVGEELHESDDALKTAQKALGTLKLACQKATREGLPVELDAEEDPRVAKRLADRDRFELPRLADRVPDRYTEGVAVRGGAPTDLALRIESEGRLGLALRTSTVSCLVSETEHPAPETVISLLKKTWRNTRVRQVLLGRGGSR